MKKLKMLGVGALAGSMLLAGCSGGEEKDPKAELRDAANNLANAQTMEVKMSFDADANSLTTDGSSLSQEDADKLLASSVTVRYDRGEDAEDSKDDIVGFDINYDGTDMASFVTTEDTVYLKVNFEDLKNQSPDLATQLEQFESLPQMSPEFESFDPLLKGEWVQIDNSEGSPLKSLMGQTEPTSEPSASAVEEMKSAMAKIFSDSEVTRDGDKLVMTTNAREAYNELYPVLSQASGAASELSGTSDLPDPSEVPDRDLKADIWVDDKKFERIDFDLSQLDEEMKERVALKMEFEDLDRVEVPSDAPTLDLEPIFGSMMM